MTKPDVEISKPALRYLASQGLASMAHLILGFYASTPKQRRKLNKVWAKGSVHVLPKVDTPVRTRIYFDDPKTGEERELTGTIVGYTADHCAVIRWDTEQ